MSALAPMSRGEAQILTDRIRRTADQLWQLLLEAYEREAWRALGYVNFREYAKNEFEFSQSRAYQLLDQGRVIKALEQATNFSTTVEISEWDARRIKPQLAEVSAAIRRRVAQGEPADAVVEDVVTSTTQEDDEEDTPDPAGDRVAFLIRADTAISMATDCQHLAARITMAADVIDIARRAEAAWAALVTSLEQEARPKTARRKAAIAQPKDALVEAADTLERHVDGLKRSIHAAEASRG